MGRVADVGHPRVADRTEEDGVGTGRVLEGLLGHGRLAAQYRRRTDLELLELVAEPQRVDDPHSFGDDFLTGEIPRNHRDMLRHGHTS